jgi:hypothetical protein
MGVQILSRWRTIHMPTFLVCATSSETSSGTGDLFGDRRTNPHPSGLEDPGHGSDRRTNPVEKLRKPISSEEQVNVWAEAATGTMRQIRNKKRREACMCLRRIPICVGEDMITYPLRCRVNLCHGRRRTDDFVRPYNFSAANEDRSHGRATPSDRNNPHPSELERRIEFA